MSAKEINKVIKLSTWPCFWVFAAKSGNRMITSAHPNAAYKNCIEE